MARIKLSTLASRVSSTVMRVEGRHSPNRYPELVFIGSNGRVLFTAARDDLFDADGNRFEDDLP